MAKKGNGEGNIRQRRDGRYGARYCVPTPEGLKRQSVYGKTMKEVAEKLANKGDDSTQPVRTNTTVREFFAEYEEAIRDGIKRRSYQTTHDSVRLHILPGFGTKELTDLGRKLIQRMYTTRK